MTALPQSIQLTQEEARRHAALVEDLQATERFIQMVMDQGKEKMKRGRTKTGEFWMAVGEKYGIDLQNTEWNVVGQTMIPVSVRLAPEAPANDG